MDAVSIGTRLKELRGDRRREDVAKAIGVGASAITMYELGRRIPRDDTKVKIAEYYGVDVVDLFYGHNVT